MSSNQVEQGGVEKCATGIAGLDQITHGGLPAGRPTLVCGGPGTGKTLFGMQFLVKGALDYNEPGVFMSFEENARDLAENVASLGFDLAELSANKKIFIDHVRVERAEIEETGAYDLDGLFVRLGYAIDTIGAKRVVLDTIETLFAALSNEAIVRSELQRLFRWLKDKGITAVITGERGEGTLTRHGLEEYVSDCVIALDQRVSGQVATRRLRIVKYRGSAHGTNEYPFLLDKCGFTVVPITAVDLDYHVSDEVISTGVPQLDEMLGGQGTYRGSTILVSGTAGCGKTSLCAHFVDAACRRGERCFYISFEESPEQLIRNMRSIGIDLQQWVAKGLLRLKATRPPTHGLDMHQSMVTRVLDEFEPRVVVLDPISSLKSAGNLEDVHITLLCLIDLFKSRQISCMFASLTEAGLPQKEVVGVSSLIDTWLSLRNLEQGGERTRTLSIIKSRGRAHSNREREFLLTDDGIKLTDVYVGPDGVLTGTARAVQEMHERTAELASRQEIERREMLIERKRLMLESKMAALSFELETERKELERYIEDVKFKSEDLRGSCFKIADAQSSRRMGGKNDGT